MRTKQIEWLKNHGAGFREATVAVLLRRYADKDGWCRLSAARLAASISISPNTVVRGLKVLRDLGVIDERRKVKWSLQPTSRRVRPFRQWQGGEGLPVVE